MKDTKEWFMWSLRKKAIETCATMLLVNHSSTTEEVYSRTGMWQWTGQQMGKGMPVAATHNIQIKCALFDSHGHQIYKIRTSSLSLLMDPFLTLLKEIAINTRDYWCCGKRQASKFHFIFGSPLTYLKSHLLTFCFDIELALYITFS